MLIRQPGPNQPASSEITPEGVYKDRRAVLAGMVATGLLPAAALAGQAPAGPSAGGPIGKGGSLVSRRTRSLDETPTSLDSVTHYNNFYEFGLGKEDPARSSGTLHTRPWSVTVDGLVAKPRTFDLDKLIGLVSLEERIYRHRCVEAWSMVIPWVGFPLAKLLALVEPQSSAKYVAFETLHDPRQMPGQRTDVLEWPYVEGLRLDEATHPLALLAVGLYGHVLPNQNGAPMRLVVPWKYGFKSIKSITRIRLVDRMPPTSWNRSAPNEYGFYANVNPEVDHPRWSQAHERRIGEFLPRRTLPYNGYGDEVAGLYRGMNLTRWI